MLGFDDARGIARPELDGLLGEERHVGLSLDDYLKCEPASRRELQWLIMAAITPNGHGYARCI